MKHSADAVLLWVVLLGVLILYGPELALMLKESLTQTATVLAPIVVPTLGVVAVVLVIRMYWHRY